MTGLALRPVIGADCAWWGFELLT